MGGEAPTDNRAATHECVRHAIVRPDEGGRVMPPVMEDWQERFGDRCHRDADGWCYCAGFDLRQVEQILDWLEVHGYGQREVTFDDDGRPVVRWRS